MYRANSAFQLHPPLHADALYARDNANGVEKP